ncbi:uncharacterized protein A4U43_C05F18100 [Asparagus officinalis]|uniref:Uncharacterized protein n=1 Tax=Asparagus officinalis TaxID=4686 RepID=A0A5P1EV02_ASPOF|nr:uncharacterized protein A4U43_C05F18100 [Asparagus officinalis]
MTDVKEVDKDILLVVDPPTGYLTTIGFLRKYLDAIEGEGNSFMCPSGINDFPMTNSTHIKVFTFVVSLLPRSWTNLECEEVIYVSLFLRVVSYLMKTYLDKREKVIIQGF